MKTEGLTMNQLAELNAEYVTTISKLEKKLTELAAENSSKSRCLVFFASVIKSGEEWTSVCEHEYSEALKSSATDAFLSNIRLLARNEGINYAASRLAAAFNHGFLDKPVAEVLDVTRMILSAKEDLANNPLPAVDGLSGEYAEQALKDWAEQLSQEAAQ